MTESECAEGSLEFSAVFYSQNTMCFVRVTEPAHCV